MTDLKRQAAQKALELLHSGMLIGLGSGSTTAIFIDLLGEKLDSGDLKNLVGVPTSRESERQARKLGIPLTKLADNNLLDLVVDGADEVDPNLNLIKGLGKALLREKFIEIHTRRLVIIVDESKLVQRLGQHAPLPVEIVKFEWQTTVSWLNTLECRAELWVQENGVPYITDNGNYLVRCWFNNKNPNDSTIGISDPYELANKLIERPGVLEHGLFLDLADQVIVAGMDGIKILGRS